MKTTHWFRALFLVALSAPLHAQTTFVDLMSQGNQLYYKKDYKNALMVYQKAADLEPKSAAIYQAIGNCQYVLGKKDAAVDSYQKSLQLNPDNPSIARIVHILRPNATPLPTLIPESEEPTATETPVPQVTPPMPVSTHPTPVVQTHPGFLFELGGGGIFAAQHGTPACAELKIGCDLSEHWAFLAGLTLSWAHLSAADWPVTGQNLVSTFDNRILGEIKWTPGGEVLQPYGLVGGGIQMDTISSDETIGGNPKFPNITSTDPDVTLGLGVESKGEAGFYLEVKVNGVFTSGGSTIDVPFTTGLRLDL